MKPKHIILNNPETVDRFIVGKSKEQIRQKTTLSDEEYVFILLGAKPVEEDKNGL